MLIEQKPSRLSRVSRIVGLKCPKCGFAKVFYKAKFPGARPQMKTSCDHCGYSFVKEEGYYRGAVYLSYGLTILAGVLAYLLARYMIFGLSNRDLILIAIGAMLFFSIWNYKLARVIWLSKSPATIV